MGCLIKMVKQKGTLKNISFIRLEKAVKKVKKLKRPKSKQKANK